MLKFCLVLKKIIFIGKSKKNLSKKATFNFDIKPVSLDDTIENAIMLVKNDSQKVIVNNINVANLQVYADSDRLEQVFVNLIENAIKYSKENSNITLDSELRKDKIVVSVKNDYDVIPREKLKTLFDKFTRIDDSTTRTTRGTGLGLFIVKGLVEGMGGEIRLYSNEECGFCDEGGAFHQQGAVFRRR